MLWWRKQKLSTARFSGRQRSDGKVVQTRFEQVLIFGFAAVAQLVEQRIRNAKVASSTPASGTT